MTAENLLTLLHKKLQGFLPLSLLTRDQPFRETCFRSHCNRCFSGSAICSKTAEIRAVCQPTPVANLPPCPLHSNRNNMTLSAFPEKLLETRFFFKFSIRCLRPGAHQSSKAAFGKSAFAKTCYNVLSFVKDTTWSTPI